jgi:hypothetical protein
LKKIFSTVKKQQNLDFIAAKLAQSLLNAKNNFQLLKFCKKQVAAKPALSPLNRKINVQR